LTAQAVRVAEWMFEIIRNALSLQRAVEAV